MKNNSTVKLAAIVKPGVAIFGDSMLDLTVKSREAGYNLTVANIRDAWPCDETGGVWVWGACEDKHYDASGKIDN